MTNIFIADEFESISEGIYKKILNQSRAISKILNECSLISKNNNKVIIKHIHDGIETTRSEHSIFKWTLFWKFSKSILIESLMLIVKSRNPGILYIRHMMRPSFLLLFVLIIAKIKKYKIYYEIPTYPYFYEQIKGSKNKILTFLRLLIEYLQWPIIYILSSKIITILSNSKKRKFKKMKVVTNGFDPEEVPIKTRSIIESTINFIGVGTIFPYHGYDRLIEAIADDYNKSGIIRYKFHIVGQSSEIEILRNKVIKNNIHNIIIFYGILTGERLSNLFNNCDIGVGCLKLFMRNADLDTTIKSIEYLGRGLPVLSSGGIISENIFLPLLKVKNDDSPIDLSIIREEFINKNLDLSTQQKIREMYSWTYIMKNILMN